MFPNFVLLLLLNAQNEILLLRRINTPFCNNCYSLPGGKIELGETARQALVREVKQSLGLETSPDDFEFVHVMHRKCNEPEFFAPVFKLQLGERIVINKQLERHDDMQWFAVDALPSNMVPAHRHAIEQIQNNVFFSEHGWKFEHNNERTSMSMRVFSSQKLWRDRIVEQLESDGSIVHWRKLDDTEYDTQLRLKLIEEAHEVCAAKSPQELQEEIADVYEVIDSLCALHGLTREQIITIQEKKRAKRGGFAERKFVEKTEHVVGSEGEKYCLAAPEKYPEIIR